MIAAVRSDIGRVRELNEDYTFLSEQFQNGLQLAIVADGMGGHLAGEVASKTAVLAVKDEILPLIDQDLTIDEFKLALEKAIYSANKQVFVKANNDEGYKGMGTTIVVAIISTHWIVLGHIGDSRAYLLNTEIKQLTSDHSLVNELFQNGQITEDEALTHPRKNILTRALGTDLEVKVDITDLKWNKGESIILCSDGLTNLLSDETLLNVSSDESSIEARVDKLLLMANEAGGEDNISIILVSNE